MRIVYLGPFRLPNLDAAASRVLNVARALRLAGHEVRFISWGGMEREYDRCPDGKYRVDGFEYTITHELPNTESIVQRVINKLTRGRRSKQLLRQQIGSYDVVITYNCKLSHWLVGFTQKHGLKLINDITEWYDYSELKLTDWLPYLWNMRVTQKRVKNKIVISSFLDRFYSRTHNIVVPATCDASEPKWQSTVECKRIKPFDGITLIYAGNPGRKDAVHQVVNAVQRLIEEGAKVRFLILGITKEIYLAQNASLIHNTNLHENISILGKLPQDQIPAYYKQADFMVLLREPNRKNTAGFPTKFAESFTSGTPVIANLTSDLGDYLKDGETGVVVKEPSEDAIYHTLKDAILVLSHEQVAAMKNRVKEVAKKLDYHAYVEPLRVFMDQLK